MTRLAKLKQPNVWIPSLFFGMFLVIIAANGTMIWVALGTWRGLQTEDAYEKGVAYNEAIAREEREAALGWDVGVDVASLGGKRANVRVALADAEGAPIHAERVRVGFVRPTQEGYDSVAELAPQGGGVYAAEVVLPLAGLWELRIAAERGEDAVHATRRVTVEP